MKFTVLGATGVIGSALVQFLQQKGEIVYAPSREELSHLPSHGNLGHVIYCIGLTGDFRSKPYQTVEAHTCLLKKILETTTFESFLYLSSTRLYINSMQNKTKETDDLFVNPNTLTDLFNLSKLLGESMCINSKRNAVRIARVSNVVGGNDDEFSQNFIPSIIRDAKLGHVNLYTTLTSEKDYVYIRDVVSLLYLIAIFGKNSIYNVASGINISNQSWMDYLVKKYCCTFSVDENAKELSFPVINVERVLTEFNFISSTVFDKI